MAGGANLICFTTGRGIVDGEETVDEAGERIFQLMLATASGLATKTEQHGYGQNKFVPWQPGAVM